MEADAVELDLAPLSLRPLVEDALELVAPTAHAKGVVISGIVDSGVPAGILGDETRLRQVLVNLLGNAVKFTDEGEVSLEVRRNAEADGSAMLEFNIVDTGVGIEPGLQDEIFRKFSQVPGQGARQGGTGLGLAIAKKLVEVHGGAIGVESNESEGSRFWFTLPLEEAEVAESWPVDSSLAGRRMLVCSAHAPSRRTLAQHLRSFNVVASVVNNRLAANRFWKMFIKVLRDPGCSRQRRQRE